MPKEEAEETKQKTKASTNGTAAGVKLGRTKGNEAENQVSRNGRERMGNQPKGAVETEATKEAEGTERSRRKASEGSSGTGEREG